LSFNPASFFDRKEFAQLDILTLNWFSATDRREAAGRQQRNRSITSRQHAARLLIVSFLAVAVLY
jgi:hypothetical protein